MHRVTAMMLAAFGVVASIIIVTAPPSPFELADEARRHGLLTEWFRDEIEELLPITTKGTRFENAWAVNARPRTGQLTVYLLAPVFWDAEGISAELKSLRGNCAHVGRGIIFCDVLFLDTFLSKRRLDQGPPFADNGRWNHLRTLLLWILAHEVAHAVEGHGSMHFGASGFEEATTRARAAHRFEFEADAHLIAIMDQEPDLQRDMLLLFSDLLRAEAVRKVSGAYPTPSEFATGYIASGIDIPLEEGGTHPDFVLRIVRLLKLAAERDEPANNLLLDDVDRLIERLKREP